MDIAQFALDEKSEIEGIWKKMGKDSRVRVARANNPKYREMFRAKTAPYDEAIKAKVLDDETSKEIVIEVMAEAVLMDWEGITEEGKEVKPSKENKIKLLTKYPAFRDFVARIAEDQEEFRTKAQGELEGNSSPASGGTSTTAKTQAS